MSRPFRRDGDGIVAELSEGERALIIGLPALIESVEPDEAAAARFDYTAHPADRGAQERFSDLVGDELERARRRDRRTAVTALDEPEMDVEQAEALMRVIGEGRLILAARLGIEEDGWESTVGPDSPPRVLALHALGWLQETLVEALSGVSLR